MRQYDENTIQQIWEKAEVVDKYNPNIWRRDFAKAWIRRDQYGTENKFGWEIDHIKPISKGGNDEFNNLNPLHWKNNRSKSDNYPNFKTVVTSLGNYNIEKENSWIVKKP